MAMLLAIILYKLRIGKVDLHFIISGGDIVHHLNLPTIILQWNNISIQIITRYDPFGLKNTNS